MIVAWVGLCTARNVDLARIPRPVVATCARKGIDVDITVSLVETVGRVGADTSMLARPACTFIYVDGAIISLPAWLTDAFKSATCDGTVGGRFRAGVYCTRRDTTDKRKLRWVNVIHAVDPL